MAFGMDSKSSQSSKPSAFHLVSTRLAAESARADAAEQQIADLLSQIRVLHQDKLNLRADLSKTQQELQLWKIQLGLAQKEIIRAQQVVDQVDQARVDAEERAHHNRQKVRRLLEERAIQVAMDEGRYLGFKEGLELGRRGHPQLPQSNPRPSARRASSAAQRRPAPSVLAPNPPPVAGSQPSRPAPVPAPDLARPLEEIRPQNENDTGPTLMPIRSDPETIPNTFDIPPDNYIPTVYGDGSRIVLPPPHEWEPRPSDNQGAHRRSDSQGTRPRTDSQGTRPKSESRASAKSARLRSDSHASAQSPPPIPTVYEHSHPRAKSPRSSGSTASGVASPQSSHLSQFDLISEPGMKLLDPRPRMTQPERIADEWRSQNPGILAYPNESSPASTIRRPTSSGPLSPVPPIPPERPTTTDPFRPRTQKSTHLPRKTREVVLPVPTYNIFYDPDANSNPSSEWLRSRFQKERTTSNVTIPNIDVEPPSHSPANSEKTAVDPMLLTPEDANRPAPLPGTDDPSSAAPISPIYNIYTRADKHQRHQSHDIIAADGECITGILPSDKNLPPGFVPLSPIPTLSNLTSIPESGSQFDINNNNNPRPPNSTAPPVTSTSSLTAKPSSPRRIYASVPVPGPLNGGLPYQGFYPVPTDIMVMRTDTSPAIPTRPSPAPLNRPFSIFSDV